MVPILTRNAHRAGLTLAFLGWFMMMVGTAHVYYTCATSGLKQALSTGTILEHASDEPHRRVRNTPMAAARMAFDIAWKSNDVDYLVEGYMWWVVIFQLLGIIYAAMMPHKLATLGMHVVLTATTFIFTRAAFSGLLWTTMMTASLKPTGTGNAYMDYYYYRGDRTYYEEFNSARMGLGAVFGGCIIVDLANVVILHTLANKVEASWGAAKPASLGFGSEQAAVSRGASLQAVPSWPQQAAAPDFIPL